MKIILIIILLFVFNCNENSDAKQKRKEANFFALSLGFLFPFHKPEPSKAGPIPLCPISTIPESTLKSINIYFNGNLFYGGLSIAFFWQRSCEPNYYLINLSDNPKLNSYEVYFKQKLNQPGYDYTGVRLYFKDNSFKDYTMNFNGDPDTFTEFTAGEYRFVAVR